MSREEEKRNLISGGGDDAAVASDEDSDSDFEFTICSGSGSPPESADAVYPVFNRNLLLDPPPPKSDLCSGSGSSSSSSSTAEEETYCARAPGSSPERCNKSSSTGSAPSRRFKLKDLVSRRSHSDGREKLGSTGGAAAADQKERIPKPSPNPNPNPNLKKKDLKPGEMDLLTAHRLFYGGKDGEKGVKGGKAYLPHRSGPVGLFANGNGLARTKFPF